MKGMLRLRSQLALIEKRPSMRLFLQGPIAGLNGLFVSRAFGDELIKIERGGQRILWRVSTALEDIFEFRARCCSNGLVAGTAGRGIAAFRAETGALAWKRLDLGGLVLLDGKLWSMIERTALVEVDLVVGRDQRRLSIGDEQMAAVGPSQVILRPDHHGVFDQNGEREAVRLYRCLNLDTGDLLWERNLAEQAWKAAQQAPHFVTNLVPGSLGESWIGRWRESTFACSREDGSLLWLARDVECGIRAATRGGRVFGMPMGGGRFYVLDERTGALLAQHDGSALEGAAYPGMAVFLDEYVVYGMESGHLAVFDPRDGRLVWVKRHKAPLSDVRVIDGLVYAVTGKGELLVYEPEGRST